ncbi:MAG: septum site-determining protein MinC [Gammaproteobacteria bacterium RIFCSPHIGHO2_12_FULL_40_19]|nr:MAG: septum site-determining protein MinC [Gammaproteobacteria bacterium RIFCSPHIGHO2_12_FULL_40_19]
MDSFQLKADFLPITILRLLRHETKLLQSQLDNITLKAPHYFANAPIVVDFSAIQETSEQMDVKEICTLLRQYQMQPIAARGLKNQDILPLLSETTEKPASTAKNKVKAQSRVPTKIITKPVRAGTQIYAKDSDLIIMASVNAGAEVIADGNIHIYAPLRGRALAGANGDTEARIFCKQLEAELVSVAGHYLLNEKMKTANIAQNMVQIYLVDNQLAIEIL